MQLIHCPKCKAPISRQTPTCPFCGTRSPAATAERNQVEGALANAEADLSLARGALADADALRRSPLWFVDAYAFYLAGPLFGALLLALAEPLGGTRPELALLLATVGAVGAVALIRAACRPSRPRRLRVYARWRARQLRCPSCGAMTRAQPSRIGVQVCDYCSAQLGAVAVSEIQAFAEMAAQSDARARKLRDRASWEFAFRDFRDSVRFPVQAAATVLSLALLAAGLAASARSQRLHHPLWAPFAATAKDTCSRPRHCVPFAQPPVAGPDGSPLRMLWPSRGAEGLIAFNPNFDASCRETLEQGDDARLTSVPTPAQLDERAHELRPAGGWVSPVPKALAESIWIAAPRAAPDQVTAFYRAAYGPRVQRIATENDVDLVRIKGAERFRIGDPGGGGDGWVVTALPCAGGRASLVGAMAEDGPRLATVWDVIGGGLLAALVWGGLLWMSRNKA